MNNLIIPTLIVSVMAFAMSLVAVVMVLAQKWSTHKIEWKPLEIHDQYKEDEEDEAQQQDDAEELEKALALQKSKKKPADPLDTILETNNF